MQQLQGLPASGALSTMEETVSQLSQAIAQLQTNSPLDPVFDVAVGGNDWQEPLQALEVKLERVLSGIPTELAPADDWHAAFQQLEAKLENTLVSLAPTVDDPFAPASDPAWGDEIKSQVVRAETSIGTALTQLAAIQQQLEPLAALPAQVEWLQGQISVPTPPAMVDVTALVEEAVQQKLATLEPSVPKADPSEAIGSLQAQVEMLKTQLDSVSASLSQGLANLPHLVSEAIVNHPSTPSAPSPATGDLTAPVEAALTQLSAEIAAIPNLVETAVQRRIETMHSELELFPDIPATSAQADDTPDWDSLLAELEIDPKG